jgi:hypothetical protein
MKALVVYESMYGNTHLVADAIAAGWRDADGDAEVVPVSAATPEALEGVEVLVVGGPTHVHGMSRPTSRKAAVEAAQQPDAGLELEPDAAGPGLRDWFDAAGALPATTAAFDTRIDAPPALTGRASKGIARRLRKHGCTLLVEPESFLVTKENELLADEEEHAREWGARLAAAFVGVA